MTGPQSDRFQISCMRHTGQKKHVMYMLGMECLWDPSNLLPKLFAEEHFKYPVKVNGQLCRRSHVAMPIEQYTTCKDHWPQYTLSCFGGSKIWSSLAVMCSDSNLMHCQECKQEVKTSDHFPYLAFLKPHLWFRVWLGSPNPRVTLTNWTEWTIGLLQLKTHDLQGKPKGTGFV